MEPDEYDEWYPVVYETIGKPDVDRKNAALKTRLLVLQFRLPGSTSEGALGHFSLENIHLSRMKGYIIEDVFLGDSETRKQVGVAYTKLTAQQKINLHKPEIQRELLGEYFKNGYPRRLRLLRHYDE